MDELKNEFLSNLVIVDIVCTVFKTNKVFQSLLNSRI